MTEHFDIYLTSACAAVPDLSAYSDGISASDQENLASRLLSACPGFLGFNLAHERAIALLKYLEYSEARESGMLVPAKYRNPDAWISLDEAERLANIEMEPLRLKYSDAKLGRLVREPSHDHPLWFGFAAPSEVWISKGLIPGALFVYVDRLDGHIWREADLDALAV